MAKSKQKKTKNKKIQEEILDSAHKIWLAGLGAVSMAEEEGGKMFKSLVEKGEGFESRSKKRLEKVRGKVEAGVEEARDKAETTWSKLGGSFDEKVSDTLRRLGVPSRHEIQQLTKRVEELTKKVDQLKPKRSTAGRKSA